MAMQALAIEPLKAATNKWYDLSSERRSNLMADYICQQNGPDASGAAYPGISAFKLDELEQALDIAQKAGLSRDYRPYHFSNINGMKASKELADEVLVKKINQLLVQDFKGDLHTLLTRIDSTDLRTPLVDLVAGRRIEVPTSFARVFYSELYVALQRYLELKGHYAERKDLRPYHLARTGRNAYSSENMQNEVIRLTIDHLILTKFGTLDKLIAQVQARDFNKSVLSMINGREALVSPTKVFLIYGACVSRIVGQYIEINGLAPRYKTLQAHHFNRAAKGSITPEVIDKLILARGDELFEHKYGRIPEAFLAGTSYKELFAPYLDYINGSPFSISMKAVKESLQTSPWKFIQRYFQLKKLDDVLERLKPTDMARLPPTIPEKANIFDLQIKTRIEELLARRFEGNIHLLIKNITAEDIRAKDAQYRMETAFKACGSSVFGFVWRYFEITNQQEDFKDLRGYHFRTTAKGALSEAGIDEILIAKFDDLVATQYQGNLSAMIANIQVSQISSPLLQVINGEVYRVSCKQLREVFSKFESCKRYLTLKGVESDYKDLQPYHVGALGIFDDPEISDGLIKKRLDDLLLNAYGNDLAALITGISREQIVLPFDESIAGQHFEVSLLRLFDLPATSSTYKIVKRYFEICGQNEIACKLRPYHVTFSHDMESDDHEKLLDLKCQNLVAKYGGLKPMFLNVCAADFATFIPVRIANLDLNVSFSSDFSSIYNGSPYLAVRKYCQQNLISFPYGKYCFTGSPESRLRKMEGRLSSRDRVRTLFNKDQLDTSAYGFRHFSSPGKMEVRQQIVDLAGEIVNQSNIKFLGLETERFELVRMLSLAHNLDVKNSVIVERDPRVINAMKSFQVSRAKVLREIRGIQILESDVESAITQLQQRFNVVHLDFFGHLTARRLEAIGQLLSRDLLEKGSLLVVTLGNSGLDQTRAAKAGIDGSFEKSIIEHLQTFSEFKIEHKHTAIYSGGEQGNGQSMQSIFIEVQ